MRLTPPKKITFIIAVVLLVLGLLGAVGVPVLSGFAFWLAFVGGVILALGNCMKGF